MHLHALLAAVGHHGDVAGYDSRYLGLNGGIDNLVHQRDVLAVDDGVYGQVRLHAVLLARGGDLAQVVDGEVVGGVRAHVQLLDAEIHAAGARLECCSQRVAAAYGCHDFKVFHFHGCKITK